MASPIQEKQLRILILEDVATDAELEEMELLGAGLEFTSLRVENRSTFEQALAAFQPDIVLADYKLPAYSGRDALEYTRRNYPRIPVIMVTGALGDEAAVELLKMGANDYVLKDRLARLVPAIERALAEEQDFRNRKLAEEKYRALFIEAMDGILLIDFATWQIADCNPEFEKQAGRTLEQLLGIKVWEIVPPEQQDLLKQSLLDIQSAGSGRGSHLSIQQLNGDIVPIEYAAKYLDIHQQAFIQMVTRDITERKRAEDALCSANRALKTLSAGNLALVRATSEEELLHSATRVIIEEGGYRLAVVNYIEDHPENKIRPMAWSGIEDGQYWAEQFGGSDATQGPLPVGMAITCGKTRICHDIGNDPAYEPWKEVALAHGFFSNIGLPLCDGNKIFGELSIYSSVANAFNGEEIRLLEELANDLAYGVIALRTRAEQERHAINLRKSLVQSIQTIAGTVEARDLYTAGHQRRVAELAKAIGQEMGLPEEQTNSIHLAAIIHDLGKIRIPAEILAKPGKLKDIEFMLIKTHAQAGFDILKDVIFPWPIANIILQHHERLDGTGYPQGLNEAAILLEAKILTVADVVEAMSSHRPYRAALGIQSALAEIERGRGIAYDPMVVDACLRLFNEKNFQFSADAGKQL